MSHTESLRLEADRKFEEGDFAGAREAYRSCLLESAPTPGALGNLSIAEDWDRLEFRIELSKRHPDSKEVRLALAHAYLNAQRPPQAVALLDELIGAETESARRIPLLLVRLRAALAARNFDIAAVDFVELWMAGAHIPPARRFRKGMLREVSGVVDPGVETMLRALESQLTSEASLLEFIAAKRGQLRALADLA
ncbi:tetratricopeptide repeat protein [Myxococcus stipitatus]|uniref:tetratricopeptide repeat protein n=1 Tax=Myxococcus stipitatus TaxID=83455 RepID=UPI003144FDBB